MKFKELLEERIQKLELPVKEEILESFIIYKELLVEWNKMINLTAIKDEEEIAVKHFVDSLTCAKYISEKERIADVGTGAGFPGMPLKIFFGNDAKLVLIESIFKKVKFLEEIKTKLNMQNVEIIQARAEEIGSEKNHREAYDKVVSRAVAELAVLAEYCLPLVRVGGLFLSMKGGEPEEEIRAAEKAISVLGGKVKSVEKITLPSTNIKHSIIVVEKVQETPKQYPRKPGTPEKKPII